MKKKKVVRKKLWGVWLSNFTNNDDDEWVGVMATTSEGARENVQYNSSRFSIRDARPAREFCKIWEIPRSWLKVPK